MKEQYKIENMFDFILTKIPKYDIVKISKKYETIKKKFIKEGFLYGRCNFKKYETGNF